MILKEKNTLQTSSLTHVSQLHLQVQNPEVDKILVWFGIRKVPIFRILMR